MGQELEPFIRHGEEGELIEVSADEVLNAMAEGRDIDIEYAIISGYLKRRGHLKGSIRIWHSEIHGNIYFSKAIFRGTVSFKSVTFDGHTDFVDATFRNLACVDSDFNRNAAFSYAVFYGNVCFGSTVFRGSASFKSATFGGSVSFSSVAFGGKVSFKSTKFAGDADFSFTTFARGASFTGAAFSEKASFKSAAFEGSGFSEESFFNSIVFSTSNRRNIDFSGTALRIHTASVKMAGHEGSPEAIEEARQASMRREEAFGIKPFELVEKTEDVEPLDVREALERIESLVLDQLLPDEEAQEGEPFELIEKVKAVKQRILSYREGQQRFKLQVSQRYGSQCAVCGISVPEVLDAAHIRPKRENGSDDPRNGLVFCALHHRAFDSGLFAIEPNTLKIHYRENGPDATALCVRYNSLHHLPRKPHKTALEWLWERWKAQ